MRAKKLKYCSGILPDVSSGVDTEIPEGGNAGATQKYTRAPIYFTDIITTIHKMKIVGSLLGF